MRDSNDNQLVRLSLFVGGLALGIALGATLERPIVPTLISTLKEWQDLAAGLLALLAAIFALRPIFGQLTEMRRQSAAASVNTSTTVVVALEDEGQHLQALNPTIDLIGHVLDVIDQESIERLAHNNFWTEISAMHSRIQGESDWLQRRVSRNPQNSPLSRSRADLSVRMREVASLAHSVDHVFFVRAADYTGGWEGEENPNETYDLPALSDRLREAASSLKKHRDVYLAEALNPAIEKMWAHIRVLEERAYAL